jgi:hypothetical protein
LKLKEEDKKKADEFEKEWKELLLEQQSYDIEPISLPSDAKIDTETFAMLSDL